MDLGTFLIFVIFLLIDMALIYKPIPILSFPVMIFFIYVGITVFYPLTSVDLPLNPLTSVFFLLFCALGLVRNAIDMRE